MNVYMYMYICVFTKKFVRLRVLKMCIYVCVYVHMSGRLRVFSVCMCVCLCQYVACIVVCMSVGNFEKVHTHLHIKVCVCVCVFWVSVRADNPHGTQGCGAFGWKVGAAGDECDADFIFGALRFRADQGLSGECRHQQCGLCPTLMTLAMQKPFLLSNPMTRGT